MTTDHGTTGLVFLALGALFAIHAVVTHNAIEVFAALAFFGWATYNLDKVFKEQKKEEAIK